MMTTQLHLTKEARLPLASAGPSSSQSQSATRHGREQGGGSYDCACDRILEVYDRSLVGIAMAIVLLLGEKHFSCAVGCSWLDAVDTRMNVAPSTQSVSRNETRPAIKKDTDTGSSEKTNPRITLYHPITIHEETQTCLILLHHRLLSFLAVDADACTPQKTGLHGSSCAHPRASGA